LGSRERARSRGGWPTLAVGGGEALRPVRSGAHTEPSALADNTEAPGGTEVPAAAARPFDDRRILAVIATVVV
jgi:hypothetical protein